MNNNFYKEYVEYEKEKSIAFDIAKKMQLDSIPLIDALFSEVNPL